MSEHYIENVESQNKIAHGPQPRRTSDAKCYRMAGRQSAKKVPGLNPRLQFAEFSTRAARIELFGIEFEHDKDAVASLEGDSLFGIGSDLTHFR